MAILIQVLPVLCYAVLVAYRLRGAAAWATRLNVGRWLMLVAMLLHAWALWVQIFPAGGLRFGFAAALSAMMWLALSFYWIESFFARVDGLQMVALPAAAVSAALPLAWPGQHAVLAPASLQFQVHFLTAMLAYSLFALAALHALLMATLERQLHRGRLPRALSGLPPLLTLESLLFRLIQLAFVFLTITLASGVLFSESLFGQALGFTHKSLFAVASWLLFGTLLLGRHLWGWRGRVAIRWTLTGFVVLLLAYVGTRFVLEVVLGRA
ncbi:MAG: hypothetical protein IOMNBAOH_01237 [Rhodocyclaceae bacterium]|nr:hypothetical protein [Rhodocyclaceae bacterium]